MRVWCSLTDCRIHITLANVILNTYRTVMYIRLKRLIRGVMVFHPQQEAWPVVKVD